jgi:hypothetical protein
MWLQESTDVDVDVDDRLKKNLKAALTSVQSFINY